MNNNQLLKTVLVIAVIGVAMFFFFVKVSLSETVKIADAKNMLGRTIQVQGEISYVTVSKDGHVFFEIRDQSGKIDGVAFEGSNIDAAYNLLEGEKVSVTGKIQTYKGKTEIVAKDITILEI